MCIGKISLSLHCHAPRDLENFQFRSTTTRRGTLKFSLSLLYDAPQDFLTDKIRWEKSKALG
jgi:hypothetical protein